MSGPGYMTADDLMNLRRPPDPPDTQPVGEKWYLPNNNEAARATIEALLQERRALLEQERAARIGDLIVAEWNDDLKKSVTTKLKGKFTHHVGHTVNGRIVLSPEETMFLLECGLLELRYGGMPLSTEEAYSIVLSGHLAMEKYQVYAYLSRLGFTVVSHHEKLGDVTSYERQMNLDKHALKRKRRKQRQQKPAKKANIDNELSNVESSSSTYDAGQVPAATFPKTTFRNALGSSSREAEPSYLSNHTEIQANEVSSMSKGEDASGAELTDSEQTDVERSESTPAGAQPETLESEKESAPSVNSVVEPPDKLEPESVLHTAPTVCEQNVQEEEAAEVVPSRNQTPVPSSVIAKPVPCTAAEQQQQLPESQEAVGKSDSQVYNSGVTSTETRDQAPSGAVLENREKSNTFQVCEEVVDDDDDDEVDSEEEEDGEEDDDEDDEDGDDDDEEEEGEEEEEDFEGDEDESYTEDDDVVTDESCNSVIRIDNENESCEPTEGDADVVFIEVSKKENEPLAVISLLSDEEEEENTSAQGSAENADRQKPAAEEEEKKEEDDDEIQIIKECTPTILTRPTVIRRENSRKRPVEKKAPVPASSSVKAEDSGYPLPRVDTSFNESTTWHFPNLLKKTVICLPRPPPHLLPFNVHLAKEAYTIDLRKLTGSREQTPRMWESYRDLQARRVASQQPNSNFRGPVWNVPPSRLYQPSPPNFSNPEPCSRTYSPHGQELPQQNSLYGSPAPPPTQGGFVKPEDVNRNSPILPLPAHLQQPQTQFLKSEMEGHHSPLLPSAHPQFPHPHQQITDYVSVATRAAMQAAQNALMSFTQRMNMQVNGCLGSGSAGMAYMPQFGGRGIPPAHSYPGMMDQVRRNFPTPDSTTDFHGAACLTVGMQPVDSRRSDSAFHQGDGSRAVSSPFYGSQPHAFVAQGDERPRSGSSGAWTRGDTWEEPFPSEIPRGPRHVASWREFKASVNNLPCEGGINAEADNEITEVPINVHEVLWSKNLSPLVKLETENFSDVLQSLQITQSADLARGKSICEKFMPTTCNLEISFDVYLPGVVYRKSCPGVPNHRIVVVRSTDPFPKTSDIVLLQRKFSDHAILQFGVVDGKDVAFYSFNFISLPVIHPGEETETSK